MIEKKRRRKRGGGERGRNDEAARYRETEGGLDRKGDTQGRYIVGREAGGGECGEREERRAGKQSV